MGLVSQFRFVPYAKVNQTGFIARRDDADVKAELASHPLEKIAAVFRFTDCAGGDGLRRSS